MATKTQRTFETRIDIPEDARETLVALLNARLADSFDLAAQATTLDEYPLDAVDGPDTLATVADRLAAFGASVRAGIDEATEHGEMDTADLFTEDSRTIDKQLWLVGAHLQR